MSAHQSWTEIAHEGVDQFLVVERRPASAASLRDIVGGVSERVERLDQPVDGLNNRGRRAYHGEADVVPGALPIVLQPVARRVERVQRWNVPCTDRLAAFRLCLFRIANLGRQLLIVWNELCSGLS